MGLFAAPVDRNTPARACNVIHQNAQRNALYTLPMVPSYDT